MRIDDLVRVVDGRTHNWRTVVCEEMIKKRNFVVIVNGQEEVEELREILHCASPPQKLERFGIYALADVLEPNDYAMLLQAYSIHEVRFVEQLHCLQNSPPRCKDFVLYCELRGIISEHDTLEEAGATLMTYLDKFARAKLFPLAGIYSFANGKWERVRKFF